MSEPPVLIAGGGIGGLSLALTLEQIGPERRGRFARDKWPQYAVHRGGLQILLYVTAVAPPGQHAVRTGMQVIAYRNKDRGVTMRLRACDDELCNAPPIIAPGARARDAA